MRFSTIIIPILDPWSLRFVMSSGFLEFYSDKNCKVFVLSTNDYIKNLPKYEHVNYVESNVSKIGLPIFSMLNVLFKLFGNESYSNYFKHSQPLASKLLVVLNLRFLQELLLWLNNILIKLVVNDFLVLNKETQCIYFDLSPYNYESFFYASRFKQLDKSKVIYVLPSWDNLYKWKTYRFYDYYLVWGNSQKVFLEDLLKLTGSVKIIGGPTVWNLFNHNLPEINGNEVLYTTVGKKLFPKEMEFIWSLYHVIQNGYLGENVILTIRLHPYDFTSLKEFPVGKNIRLVRPNSSFEMQKWLVPQTFYSEFYNELRRAKIVICMASSVTLDAVCFGRLVINILDRSIGHDYYSFEHYKPISCTAKIPILDIADTSTFVNNLYSYLNMDEKAYHEELALQRKAISEIVDLDSSISQMFSVIESYRI